MLVLRNGYGAVGILHSIKGVAQGVPLTMNVYGIDILPLTKNLNRVIHDVIYPWYADDARALRTFAILENYFDSITRQGPGQGYYSESSNSVLIVSPENLEAGKVFRARHGFKVCTGARYLGGYIRDNNSKHDCLRESTLTWENNINTIRKTAGKYPLEGYATVVREIQFNVSPGIREMRLRE